MTRLVQAALAVTFLAVPAPAHPQDSCGQRIQPPPGMLVPAEWLRRHREDSDRVILHPERSRAPCDSAHVVGARFVAKGNYTTRTGDLVTEPSTAARLDSLFESLGVTDCHRIVLYGETLGVTRLFFTFDYMGLARGYRS